MLKNILNLEQVKDLTKEAQKSIKGGMDLPSFDDCGCVVVGPYGYLEIVAVSCTSTCPDGSDPRPGLGY